MSEAYILFRLNLTEYFLVHKTITADLFAFSNEMFIELQ